MKTLGLLTLAAVALFAAASGASAQSYYSGPGYGPQIEPRYEQGYRHDNRRYYHTARHCRRGYTVQDGVCKPYTGR